ncbi:RNA polymerase sigma factor [Pendulispora albinea]|uniref:RNA polymerase sigma factor n=1 Tax=Pendulispora albinea TaxID=2741071 RepID=A0ABZ2LS07_9BACT
MPSAASQHKVSPASESDEALVARVGLRDEVALRVLHARHAARIFTIAARMAGESVAEDVVQDVLLTVWRKHETFDPARGSFKSWIAQITRRHALNELRRRRRYAKDVPDELEDVPAEALEPDEAQWAAHRRAVVRRAVAALPVAERQALSLAFFDELTHEQVASTLRTPLGTAKSRIRLGMKRLAPVLAAVLVAVVAFLGWKREHQRQELQARALRMVTSSDVVPIRLGPTEGTPPAAHGTYRARAGTGIAVLTVSYLPSIAGAERYAAWVRHGEHWTSLGMIDVRADGSSLLTCENESLATPADEVRVTREANAGPVPRGPAVLEWPVAHR